MFGRSRRRSKQSRVRFRSGRLWRPERRACCRGAYCFIFASYYRASSCWYFRWYRPPSTMKTISNSNGYGIRRLPARGRRAGLSHLSSGVVSVAVKSSCDSRRRLCISCWRMSPAAFEAMSRSRSLLDEKRNLRCGIKRQYRLICALWESRSGARLSRSAKRDPLSSALNRLLSTAIGGAELDAFAAPKAVRRSASWRACATRSWA